jgi:hypothetical protein
VFGGSEIVLRAVVVGLKLRIAFDRLLVGKERNRIVTLDTDAFAIKI